MAERLTEGTLLKVDKSGISGETPVYTTVALITSIDGPTESVGSVERTPLAGSSRRYRPGLHDGGEFSYELMFDPDDVEHIWLHGRMQAKTQHTFQIFIPAALEDEGDVTIQFNGFLTEWGLSAGGPEEIINVSVSIKVDGEVTYDVDTE